MRLTLRTMLAYMDDILEPADHQDVGQKIEESEFATNLLHKIRDVTRRMRMGAPKVSGRGMGLDPNTVAEYLDNVLSGERVPDFEKVCLESDVHLAEVAACHQILSLVLGEPADVDPALRRRMYEIVARSRETGLSDSDEADGIAAPPPPMAAEPVAAAALAATNNDRAVPARERPEVPEYLRSQRRSRFWPIAITALLAACLVVAVGMALWGWDRTNPMLRWLPWDKIAPKVAQNDAPSKNGGDQTKNGDTNPTGVEPPANPKKTGTELATAKSDGATTNPTTNSPTLPPPVAPTPSPVTPSPVTPAPAAPPGTVGDGSVKPATGTLPGPATGQTSTSPPGTVVTPPPAPTAPASGTATTSPTSPDGPQPRPAVAPPAPGAVVGPASPDVVATNPVRTAPNTVPGPAEASPNGPPLVPPNPLSPSPKTGPATSPPGAERLGLMVSEQELLLRLPAGQGEWQRVTPGQTLGMKDRLLALPTFRPMITLSAGVTIKLLPETLLELEGNDPAGIPIVQLKYGRMVMRTTGKPDLRVQLILGDTVGTLTFFDPDATAAIEVRPMLVPGTDPQTGPPKTVVAVYATVGQIDWTGAGNARAVAPAGPSAAVPIGGKLTAPSRVVLMGSSADVSGGEHELPRWVVSEPVNPLDLDSRAAQSLNQSLDGKISVTVALKEMVEHRRAENRSLAARSLALIDEFDPFAALLNDPDQRAVWPIEIESLQAAVARGPVSAGKVRAMFEKERGKEGDDLYRLLWGFNKDQLQSGSAPTLIDDLDNDSLDFRVLSFENLKKIVGKTFDYRPEATAANRAQPVRRWRDQLKEGLIVPKGSAPSKAPGASAKAPDSSKGSDSAKGLLPPAEPTPSGEPIPPVAVPPVAPAKIPPPPVPGQP